jgi:uncharacterized short protein YbdD (DUF466 family)
VDVFSLSRNWFEFCFNNPEKIKPGHSAVYFFAIEHCNRLGWKDKFGFPSQMVMEAVGIKNWRTYSAILKELVGFGFIEMIEISKNQYSSNIIAIVKNTKAHTKALDKALQKHSTKQRQSTVSIDIQETRNNNTRANTSATKTIEQREKEFYSKISEHWKKSHPDMPKEEVRNFFDYWTERGDSDKKMRYEKEKTFGISRRMTTWKKNNFGGNDTAEQPKLHII